MGVTKKAHQPCPNPECGSSDAFNIYADDSGYCFSCQYSVKDVTKLEEYSVDEFKKTSTTKSKVPQVFKKQTLEEVNGYISRGFKDRGITKAVCEFFDVKVSYDENGDIDTHYYPYGSGNDVTGYKCRKLPKEFTWVGESGGLFGQRKFNGGGKRLVVVEGEIDALSIAQMYLDKYQQIYPVIALSSAAAVKELLANRDWIRSFKEVVLCMDNDEPGQEAQAKAIKIIGVDKVKIAKLPVKDANEMLVKEGSQKLIQHIWDAATYTPVDIMRRDALWNALVAYNDVKSHPYPACTGGLNDKLKGKRLGEIVLFISGSGSGKSTLMREIGLDILETTDSSLGIISLEEAPAETARKMSGMALNRNPAHDEIPIEELKVGFDKVFGDDRVIVLDHQGALGDGTLQDQLEFMCLSGCQYILLDHITMMASEGSDDLRGNEAVDKIMNSLLRLVKKYPVWLGVVSHLRKAPQGGRPFEEGRLPGIDDIKGCLAYDTEVLLYDGHVKFVQDVQVGDVLMGDDGDPRNVLKLFRGEQQMFKVTMKTTGDTFVCNEDHILTVSYNDKLMDIPLKHFIGRSDSFKTRCKQHYSTGYELPERPVLIPAYSLGAWLGDGSKSAFRIMDAIGLGIVERVASELCAELKAPLDTAHEYFSFDTGVVGDMLNRLKTLNLFCNKHIPEDYLINSKKVRYELLAGLIDTDGTYAPKDNTYYFYQKDYQMALDVRNIARSLGLYSNIRSQVISSEYSSNGSEIFVVTISGDIEKIPAQKSYKLARKPRFTNALKRGFSIEKLDSQPYYGFGLDGNGRFLLGNHIVTHNSGSIKQVSFDIVAFARNMVAEDEFERNSILMRVLKCRYTGLTGDVKGSHYNYETGRLSSLESAPREEFHVLP